MITQKNYEIYFADYLDGTLGEAETAELKAFLLVHPELSKLIEDTDKLKLQKPTFTYLHKESLKKTELQECPDYYAIAAAEEVLTEKEKKQLKERFTDQEFQASVRLYQQLRLKPNPNIHFNKKNKLYKKQGKRILLIQLTAVAAVLSLFLLIRLFTPSIVEKDSMFSDNRKTILPLIVSPHFSTLLETKGYKPSFELAKVKSIKPTKQIIAPISSSMETVILLTSDTEIKLQEIAMNDAPEIILTESAKTWRASSDNVGTKNIITSVIHAGKNLTQRMKKNNINAKVSVTY